MDEWSVDKYELSPKGSTLMLPEGAQVLSVAFQADLLQLWALVNTSESRKVKRHFRVITRGDAISFDRKPQFIGTARYGTWLVFHVFETE